jgi:cell division protein FtsQ
MKASPSRRRSEKIRRKLSEDSQQYIRRASARLQDTPAPVQKNNLVHQTPEMEHDDHANARKRRFHPGWRVLSLALCGFFSYSLFDIWRSSSYLINQVEISGLQRLEESQILSVIALEGTHVLALDPIAVQTSIVAAFPELRQARVRVNFPAQVGILVSERQPIISWQAKNNRIWIDGEGYLIPARGEALLPLTIQSNALPAYSLQLPVNEFNALKTIRDKDAFLPGIAELNFFSIPKKINIDLLEAILQLNAWMPEEKTLLHQSQRGLGWHDDRGWDVYVGQRLENINDKMMMYQMIVRELEQQGINPTLVSVEFLHAPYYRTGE